MPLMNCSKCDHEWESTDKESLCDWCGAAGKVLEDKTPMEEVKWDKFIERFKAVTERSVKTGKPIIITMQKKKEKRGKCRCRPAKTHKDCAYCGIGYSDHICGVCKEGGIDGPVIRGTSRVICKLHKKPDPITKFRVEMLHKIMSTEGISL